MSNEELIASWDSIAKALTRIIKRVEKLPPREHDDEFDECLDKAFCHAEARADALTDPS